MRDVFERDEDGYLNVGMIAVSFNRLVSDWLMLDDAQAYLSALSEREEIPVSDLVSDDLEWAHPFVALKFGRWCDIGLEVYLLGLYAEHNDVGAEINKVLYT
jgi:hypothetical protein